MNGWLTLPASSQLDSPTIWFCKEDKDQDQYLVDAQDDEWSCACHDTEICRRIVFKDCGKGQG